jgi:hypothetical protein
MNILLPRSGRSLLMPAATALLLAMNTQAGAFRLEVARIKAVKLPPSP